MDRGRAELREKFQMEPPENAWSRLNAELEKKQAMASKKRGNRFKLLSIALALLLISGVIYYYLSPAYVYTLNAVVENNTPGSVKNAVNKTNDKPIERSHSEVKNTTDDIDLVFR